MKVWKCDRCGKIKESPYEIAIITIGYKYSAATVQSRDVCSTCMRALMGGFGQFWDKVKKDGV